MAKANLEPSSLALRKGETEETTKGIRTRYILLCNPHFCQLVSIRDLSISVEHEHFKIFIYLVIISEQSVSCSLDKFFQKLFENVRRSE